MTVVDLYTIQITFEGGTVSENFDPPRMAESIAEAEENLTLLLPPGYRARIRRWDTPNEGTPSE